MLISLNNPLKFLGAKNAKFRRFFSAAHSQMATLLPNTKSDGKSKTIVYMVMFGLCSELIGNDEHWGDSFYRKTTNCASGDEAGTLSCALL